jgi:hypothetical protein
MDMHSSSYFSPFSSDPVSEELFLLRSTIIDLETMRTPYEPASRGYMALTTAISILQQMHDMHALASKPISAENRAKLKLVKELND